MWPHNFGPRPTFQLMADRLAQSGHAVLVVNPTIHGESAWARQLVLLEKGARLAPRGSFAALLPRM